MMSFQSWRRGKENELRNPKGEKKDATAVRAGNKPASRKGKNFSSFQA